MTLLLSSFLSLGCAGFGHVFLRAGRAGEYRRAFWLKGLAGLCFVAVGLLAASRCGDARRAWLVPGGLILGLLGDELLALRFVWPERHDKMFLLGALAFSLGHVLYLLALLPGGAVPQAAWPVFALGLLASFFYARHMRVDFGRFLLPGVVYIALVVFLAAVSCGAAASSLGIGALLFALGGLCFAVSDNLLCARSFGDAERDAVNRALHISYYAAQLLIAWSLRWT